MTTDLDPYLQEMGRLALEVAADAATKVMIYAEADPEEGLSADIYFADDEPDVIHYRLCPPMLEAVIDAFRDVARLSDPRGAWQVMRYVVDDGAFQVTFRYEDDLEEHEDISERRPLAIAEVFGPGLVDYSRPGL
ncbi:MAG: hypothetical protein KF842_01665 [Caulobacter sp.]|nr:hypothetical protein [Caulobacter sp.]